MKLYAVLLPALLINTAVAATCDLRTCTEISPARMLKTRQCKPPAFFLAGDSTTAVQSAGGGGWGNGFISFLTNSAKGINLGHNGATTVSFKNGGDWDTVLQNIATNKNAFDCYVTIQVCRAHSIKYLLGLVGEFLFI
jgi:hypothetical protein